MADDDDVMVSLSDAECRELLRSQSLGRLVERIGEQIEVFPVNVACDGERIIFRTAPGTKLAGLVAASEVLFQADQVGEHDAWSVVARGVARILEHEDEIARAESYRLRPLVPTVKRVFVELAISEVSGRRFLLGEEPEAAPETAS